MNRKSDTEPESSHEGDRIAKVMARAGLCSRREAEAWIAAGRVAVNGAVISSPALNVGPSDHVVVDGKPLPMRERTRLFLYHKPRGLVTTHVDPQGRPTIFAALPKDLPRLISVGRLDLNTEGLLLLTNDGGLARVLELPQTGWLRRYRVRAHGSIMQDRLDKLRDGITIDGVHYGRIDATLDRVQGSNVWLTFAIREGKNREVRNVLSELGLSVNRLIRVSFGPFQLGELAEGAIEEVKTRHLREQLSDKLIAQAGADFAGPISQAVAAPLEKAAEPRGEERPRRDGHKRRHPEGRGGKAAEPGKSAKADLRTKKPDLKQARDRQGAAPTQSSKPGHYFSRPAARPPQADESKGRRPSKRKRSRADRSSGPRPSRPRPR